MKKFILFIAILALVACAPTVEKSRVKFSLAAITGSAQFPSGLLLSGNNVSTGETFSKIVNATDSIDFELPNGKWHFSAIGWKSLPPTGNMEGEMHCDFILLKELTGEDVTLSFSTSMNKCTLRPLLGGKFNGEDQAYKLELNTCLGIKNYIQEQGAAAAPDDLVCGAPGQSLAGSASYAKVSLLAKNLDGSPSGILSSRCLPFTGSQAGTEIRLPYVGNEFGFSYAIETYSDVDCNNTVGVYNFKQGFKNPAANFLAGVTPNDTTKLLRVFLHEDTCSGVAISSPDPTGPSHGPYLICTKEQFEKIGTDHDITVGADEQFATYTLGQDINFGKIAASGAAGVDKVYVKTPFSGSLDGNGHSLIGGRSSLFSKYILPPVAANPEIKNLKIRDFQINDESITENSLGILFNQFLGNTTTFKSSLDVRNVEIENTSSINHTSSAVVGGLIGRIDLTAAGASQNINLDHNSIYMNINNRTTSPNSYTGGLVGSALGNNTSNSDIRIYENVIGANRDNPNDMSKQVTILGKNRVGGIVGDSSNVSVGYGNSVNAKIFSDNDSGGIVGRSSGSTNIAEVRVKVKFTPNTPSAFHYGGLVGKVESTGAVDIRDSLVDLELIEAGLVDSLGGVIGKVDSVISPTSIKIVNSKTVLNIAVDGNYHGGVFGYFKSINTPFEPSVRNTIVTGKLLPDSPTSATSIKGGIAGYADNLKSKMILVDDIEIEGDSTIGGAYGFAVTRSGVEESDLDFDLRSNTVATVGNVGDIGGIVGMANTDNTANQFIDIRIRGTIQVAQDIVDCSGNLCGLIAGSNSDAEQMDKYVNIATDITFRDSAGDGLVPSPVNIGGGSQLSNFLRVVNGATNGPGGCSDLIGMGAPFSFEAGECKPVFAKLWRSFGGEVAGETLAGNIHEPFKIFDVNEWNSIGINEGLLTKTFILQNDLDFGDADGNFTTIGRGDPGGGGFIPFKGKLVPNSKSLNRIRINSPTLSGIGVFGGISNSAQIGSPDDPLVINGFELDCSSRCGMVGYAEDGFIRSIVNAGIVNGKTSGNNQSNAGGLVGIAAANGNGRLEIFRSSFSGRVTGHSFLGGLIGQISQIEVEIEESFAELTYIGQPGTPNSSDNNFVGGMVGLVQEGGLTNDRNLKIENSYVRITAAEVLSGPIPFKGALIGGHKLPLELTTVNNTFADFTGVNFGANFSNLAKMDGNGGFGPASVNTAFIGAGSSVPALQGASHVDELTNSALSSNAIFSNFGEFEFDSSLVKLKWE